MSNEAADALAHEVVAEATATRWALVLHGVFGSLKNWRGFARRLSKSCPEWGFVLVDLPGHGSSASLSPPHDLQGVSDRLAQLVEGLDHPVHGIIGHSLGGKIALHHASRSWNQWQQLWVLDSRIGVESAAGVARSPAMHVLQLLRSLDTQLIESRAAFVETLQSRGLARPIAQWLAMNLRAREAGGMSLALDLEAIAVTLESYFGSDLWPDLERMEEATRVHIVVAGKSGIFEAPELERLDDLENSFVVVSIF